MTKEPKQIPAGLIVKPKPDEEWPPSPNLSEDHKSVSSGPQPDFRPRKQVSRFMQRGAGRFGGL